MRVPTREKYSLKFSTRVNKAPVFHWLGLVLGCAFVFFLTMQAQALSVTVSPLLVELDLPPGAVRTTTVEVRNTGEWEANITVNLSDFHLASDGTVELSSREESETPFAWLNIRGDTTFRLRPDEVRRIPLEVRPPRGTRGGLYAAVVFEVTPHPLPARGQVIGIRSGTLVFLSIMRTSEMRGAVGEVNLEADGPAVEALFENAGNVHWSGEGRVVITNQEGRVIERLTLESGTGLVLPGGKRIFTGVGTRNLTLEPGIYEVDVRLYAHTPQRPISLDRKTVEVVVEDTDNDRES